MATEIEMKLGVPSEEVLNKIMEDPALTQYMKDDYDECRFGWHKPDMTCEECKLEWLKSFRAEGR